MERQKWLSIDGKLWRVLTKVGEALILNFFWLILSVPVLTSGAATIAFYYAMTKAVRREQGGYAACFRASFRLNLKASILPTAIAIAAVALYWPGIQKIWSCGNTFAQTLCFAIAVLLTAIFFWICPLLSRFELRADEAWRMAFYCAIRHFPRTAVLLLAAFAGGSLIWIFLPAVIFVPCMLMALASRILEPVLVGIAKNSAKNQSDSEADPWYLSE